MSSLKNGCRPFEKEQLETYLKDHFNKPKWRADFPFFTHNPDLIYLDSAATAHKPKCALETVYQFYERRYATIHRGRYQLALQADEAYSSARRSVASFINAARAEEIVFTKGATASLNLVARSFGRTLRANDAIAISEIEHHANIVPWQMICEAYGLRLEIIRVEDSGDISLDHFKEVLQKEVKLISIAHMSNTLGTIHPLKELIALSHQAGARVCIDGAQGAAHTAVDVQALDCDFYIFSSHKLYGPTGVGVLYGKNEHLEKMAPVEGGGDMVNQLLFEKTSYTDPPSRFEAGTASLAEILGFEAALHYIQSIGMDKIAAWEEKLDRYALQALSQIEGVRFVGKPRMKGPLSSFVIEGIHPLDMGMLLEAKNVAVRTGHHCSQPTMKRFHTAATIRISFGLYNTFDEVDQFLSRLQSALNLLRS